MTAQRSPVPELLPWRQRMVRRAQQFVIALTVFGALACVGMIVTAAIDDYQISRDQATATADVLDVGKLRTTVRFHDNQGNYHQPDKGLKYPSGLVEGQKVRVEYQQSNPKNVKVAGRGWTLSFRPALSSLAVVLLAGGGIWLALRSRLFAKTSPA
ncbi:putative secreted protein [Corynebacterium resistens DSM 45100]|uniref:Secreted protein n=1 Tax=Corynebacterium resistens (strain DSM 45100 / JCM 12819 / GTC 2026 / SICGH 158) TaxID=662755 RepID=F8E2Q0_CORRG|nr:DUF3592 domain-containing protein [Corynebacterium resistens]AEI10273.1 putative secreted protein [Corynebacterium resistens DSM 45100]